jgi:hypothetical protein
MGPHCAGCGGRGEGREGRRKTLDDGLEDGACGMKRKGRTEDTAHDAVGKAGEHVEDLNN